MHTDLDLDVAALSRHPGYVRAYEGTNAYTPSLNTFLERCDDPLRAGST